MTLHHLFDLGLTARHLHLSFWILSQPLLHVATLSEALGRSVLVVHLSLAHLFLVCGWSSMRGIELHVVCKGGRVGNRQHVLSSSSLLASRLVSYLSLALECVVDLDIKLHLHQLILRLDMAHVGACPHILRIHLSLHTHFALQLHLCARPVGVLVRDHAHLGVGLVVRVVELLIRDVLDGVSLDLVWRGSLPLMRPELVQRQEDVLRRPVVRSLTGPLPRLSDYHSSPLSTPIQSENAGLVQSEVPSLTMILKLEQLDVLVPVLSRVHLFP